MDDFTRIVFEMSSMFKQRMADFEEEHKNNAATPGLSPEYIAFRTFIMQALSVFQQQVNFVVQSMDNMQMRSRRKILLLHGVSESEPKEEDTTQVVVQVVKDRLKLDIKPSDIKRCHRMGRVSQKARPILLKLHDVALRDNIWRGKTKCKGSGVTISEFLTKIRHNTFMAARERFGVNQCWTREGTIYVLDSKGARHRVTSMDDLEKIEPQPPERGAAQPVTAAAGRNAVPRARRAAAASRK
ncbi:uncharacterized protein LOC111358070 [Spodoptera litura]|uniref:Uncharacterized protein LOC111348456 n=1 Tax=Spodoptera litura TaxID=69820 RepID=A0A9J7IV60_SPOLT|nr:uncharacterized protein LOC111348456 [Spodoptera litura]XP_022824435.1 uncharacterized protein LOC111354971 [Spodoptera litura]XP_022827383.1 uncharacterized protein LOC111357068 [Spodoptera litura]XP_022828724.1 uncharacterized protein LOC111358070 [Spodoptera litura]